MRLEEYIVDHPTIIYRNLILSIRTWTGDILGERGGVGLLQNLFVQHSPRVEEGASLSFIQQALANPALLFAAINGLEITPHDMAKMRLLIFAVILKEMSGSQQIDESWLADMKRELGGKIANCDALALEQRNPFTRMLQKIADNFGIFAVFSVLINLVLFPLGGGALVAREVTDSAIVKTSADFLLRFMAYNIGFGALAGGVTFWSRHREHEQFMRALNEIMTREPQTDRGSSSQQFTTLETAVRDMLNSIPDSGHEHRSGTRPS